MMEKVNISEKFSLFNDYWSPKGVEHLPIAQEEAHVIFFEPKSTVNTGEEVNERTVSDLPSI
jgi:hypothetical protein